MPNTDLWAFALACYARPGVESACLALQAHGADVCLLLCAAWLEARGIACTPPRRQRLEELARPWQEQVVRPLRQLRQDWRTPAGTDAALHDLRETLKALELEAERALLLKLQETSRDWQPGSEPPEWLAQLEPAEDCRAALETLRPAARQTQLGLLGA